MSTAPKRPHPPGPPVENGDTLAVLVRPRGEELHVTLSTFNGHRYVGLRVWAPGPDGWLLPVKGKGCSVRIGELREVADALVLAAQIVEDE